MTQFSFTEEMSRFLHANIETATTWNKRNPDAEHDEVHHQLEHENPDMPGHVREQLKKLSDKKEFGRAYAAGKVKYVSPKEARTGIANTGESWLSVSDKKKKARAAKNFAGKKPIGMPIVLHHVASGHKHLLGGHTALTYSSQVKKQKTPVLHIQY